MVNRQEMRLASVSAAGGAQAGPPKGAAPAAEAIGLADELAGPDAAPPFHSVPNPSLKPGYGRLVVAFPQAPQRVQARVEVRDSGSHAVKQITYGSLSLELMSAAYNVSINGITIAGVPLQAGQDTLVHVGVLHTHADRTTRIDYFAPGGRAALNFAYGEAALGFPAGTVDVAVQGQRESVRIEDGKITEY